LLDVTFDGRVLSNGDYTSANPAIQIVLKDENEFLLKTDTLGMNIFLGSSCNQEECVYKRIPFSSSQIKWYAATSNSDFKVIYNPLNLGDGVYGLKVEAADASGNLSGTVPYEILFNVKGQTSLTFNGVYPNPSSIGFFFNFQLTGNALPDKFVLEIFSSTGQLVTQFNEVNAGEFYIGSNELVWDGTDSSGITLSNGIYLYRLTIQVNGLEKIESGKLVLVK
jgi:hypothetical protein